MKNQYGSKNIKLNDKKDSVDGMLLIFVVAGNLNAQ